MIMVALNDFHLESWKTLFPLQVSSQILGTSSPTHPPSLFWCLSLKMVQGYWLTQGVAESFEDTGAYVMKN